jgi:hypothetical protein
MAYDDALFRAQIPEFASTTTYPEVSIAAFWDVASIFIAAEGSPCGVLNGKSLALALNYMTAHLMILSNQQNPATGGTGAGTAQGGFETSATIGEISVAKLAPPAKDAWDWWLYQTPYGQALMALLKLLAVGGLMVGGLPERTAFRKVGGVFW